MSEEIDPTLFESAAQEFFRGMKADIERLPARARRKEPIDLAEQIELSQSRAAMLVEQIATGEFDRNVMGRARLLAAEIGVSPDALGDDAKLLLKTLTARAELEAMRFHVRYLNDPVGEYREHDPLFRTEAAEKERPASTQRTPLPLIGIRLSELTELYLTKKKDRLAERTIVESRRVFDWLAQHFNGATPVAALDKARLRDFRDALIRLSKGHQGRGGLPFASRQTDVENNRVSTKTASKYWSFIQSFFSWAEREGHIEQNPTTGLRVEIAVGDESRSPEPFSNDEVRLLLNTPLYRGHNGKNLNEPGHDLARGGYYWTGLIGLFTGARAGEIAQLLTTDFHFDGPVAYISFRTEDSVGKRTKTLKNKASARDIPIAPNLMALGLDEWVGLRLRYRGEDRVFPEIRLGSQGNMSDGMSKWWGRHFRKHGLHKERRGPHVWRHTITDILRNADVSREMIDAITGHTDTSMTGGYGKGFSLEAKATAIAKIDFGFDVAALLKDHEQRLNEVSLTENLELQPAPLLDTPSSD